MSDIDAIKATPTGMAPASDPAYVLHAGYQTPLDAADPIARTTDFVDHTDDPIANRDWRASFGEQVEAFLGEAAP